MSTTTAPLISKDRKAAEFRERASALRDKLGDPEVTLNHEEVLRMTDEIKTLEMRAQTVADFTPDAEINRQGGDLDRVTGLPIDSPTRETRQTITRVNKFQQELETRSKQVMDVFGSHQRMLDVMKGKVKGTADQTKVIQELGQLARMITGETGGGAEVLMPLTQVQSIFSLSNAQPGVMQTARMYNVPGRTLRIPYLIQDEGTTTLNRPMAGKIANVTIVGEGSTKPERDPQFGQRLMTIYKYAAVTQIGDETLADDFTGELPAEVTNAVGQQAVNALNEDVTIDGDGNAQPLGAFNAANGAIMYVNRQTAGTIKAQDAINMFARHTHGPKSHWLVSRYAMAQLYQMTLNGNNTLVTYLTNLRDAPQMMLLGLPVVMSDLMNPLGQTADIALVNGEFYAFALRQALTIQSSIDYAFVEDLTTYRFVIRGGGIPIPTSTYAYKIGTGGAKVDPHSPFTVLDASASS